MSRAAASALILSLARAASAGEVELPSQARIDAVRRYIKEAWSTLSRSNRELPLAAQDPKLHLPAGTRWPVYLSCREDRSRVETELRALLGPQEMAKIELRVLPPQPLALQEHGLLYLPRPYVVPGGRFNEMYGWDSYFIQVGLLRDGELARARDMADNFVYEIEHYGTILNANRSYYLSRSQPPFLSAMLLGVFRQTHDKDWLRGTLSALEAYYQFWTSPPHLAGDTGLSRYFDLGDGPAAEVMADERDAQGRTHYDRVHELFRSLPAGAGDDDLSAYYDRKADRLTDLFYKGDRSMRESGFDPSNRFGPQGVDVIHYAPVCLNALLYRMEQEAAEIVVLLGRGAEEERWRERARRRREAIDRYLWDEKAGLYFDYNVLSGQRRPYEFATTFYPLWVGAASVEQARRVEQNLPLFEAPGGILTSTRVTGNQWDAPFGWGPLQMIAVEGLRRFGYHADADRVARKFLSMVVEDFEAHGVILEKYDVRRRSSEIAAGIRYGYSTNVVGFGWTNAAFVELLAGLKGPHSATDSAASAPSALSREGVCPSHGSDTLPRNTRTRSEARTAGCVGPGWAPSR
jgi:alpha,alpha-trehalase